MYNSSRVIAIIFILLYQTSSLNAQLNSSKYELGIGLSSFIYQGDLTPHIVGSVETMRWGINIHGSRIMSPSFLLRTNLTIGGLKGDDAKYNHPEFRKQRNFNFSTPVVEISQLVVWNPMRTNYADKKFSPYFFGGIGLSFLKIKRDWSKFNAEYFGVGSVISDGLVLDEKKSLPRIIPVIPLGGGIRYNLSDRIAVNAEASYRLTYTDYIDGFSKAANPKQNDHYITTSVGAIYRIGKKSMLDCPTVGY